MWYDYTAEYAVFRGTALWREATLDLACVIPQPSSFIAQMGRTSPLRVSVIGFHFQVALPIVWVFEILKNSNMVADWNVRSRQGGSRSALPRWVARGVVRVSCRQPTRERIDKQTDREIQNQDPPTQRTQE